MYATFGFILNNVTSISKDHLQKSTSDLEILHVLSWLPSYSTFQNIILYLWTTMTYAPTDFSQETENVVMYEDFKLTI